MACTPVAAPMTSPVDDDSQHQAPSPTEQHPSPSCSSAQPSMEEVGDMSCYDCSKDGSYSQPLAISPITQPAMVAAHDQSSLRSSSVTTIAGPDPSSSQGTIHGWSEMPLQAVDDGLCTPKKCELPFCGMMCTPELPEHVKTIVGIVFPDLISVEKFYKDYAHLAGFSVRIGQHKKVNGAVTWKRYYCSKEGFREGSINSGNKLEEAPKLDVEKKRKYDQKLTKCGCEAMLTVKQTKENTYRVEYFQPMHSHVLVSPSKKHLIRSNRQVSDKAKTTLFDCHKASIGTFLAYRYLRVSDGGFQNVGCTRRDFQNYHASLRNSIKSSDAQLFSDNLARKNSINPGFYFDYVVDDKGRLVHVFWADVTCKKNYAHFGDLVSFDSTYNTNQYNMIFTPFTGVNHHGACVLFGAALISNEKTETYKWLFSTFLKAMGGTAPRLIITDEDASMKAAILDVFTATKYRLCMWHILKKLPEKVGPHVRENAAFYKRVNFCVYSSEICEEFEAEWASIIADFNLEGNEWLDNRYRIRVSWIPAYFRDILLGVILRTTSRSESTKSFFNHFIGYKHALVEFWVRFDTVVEEQREKELKDDNDSLHTLPLLKTGWLIEKHGSEIFTYAKFLEFQKQVLNSRDHCVVDGINKEGNFKIFRIADDSSKMREVRFDTSTMIGTCSCMLFETHGIPCSHIIHVLRSAKLNELPSHYVLQRWSKNCKRKTIFDEDGYVLEENANSSMELEIKKVCSQMRKDLEDIIRQAGNSMDNMLTVRSKFDNFVTEVKHELPGKQQSTTAEMKGFIGSQVPTHVDILPPTDVHTKGRSKRIRGHSDKGVSKPKKNERAARMCKSCNKLVFHDKRNCPKKIT